LSSDAEVEFRRGTSSPFVVCLREIFLFFFSLLFLTPLNRLLDPGFFFLTRRPASFSPSLLSRNQSRNVVRRLKDARLLFFPGVLPPDEERAFSLHRGLKR